MKKLLSVLVMTAMVLAFAGMASAISQPICATVETTFVSGVVTDATNGNTPVEGADVTVTCNGVVKTAVSGADGGYSVQYTALECPKDSKVSVSASYDGLNGESETIEWYSQNSTVGCLELIVNVACGNVPMVPEFTGIIAGLTVLGALGAFLVVRRN